jgi:hypothetical protein
MLELKRKSVLSFAQEHKQEVIMRVAFSEIFNDNGDGSYTPKGAIRVGAVTMGSGVAFRSGVQFSGVDIAQYVGKDLEIVTHPGGIVEITGFYQ